MTACVLFVPGIMGSELFLHGEKLWPGGLLDALITEYDKLDKLMDDAVVPGDIIRKVFVFGQYQALIDDLELLGFQSDDTLFTCPYDWRKGNDLSAKTLATALKKVVATHADAEITILAHSMGGLVTRFYLESGHFQGDAEFGHVKRLITLGTPHFGAPKALGGVLGLEQMAFLKPAQVQKLSADKRYTSAYQLLPHQNQPYAWDRKSNPLYQVVDVFGPTAVARLGLSQHGVDDALNFHASLDPEKAPVPYFCFVGTRQNTIAVVHLDLTAASAENQVFRIEPDDSGDGTVPTWSAGLPRVQGLPVGGEHATIYKNRELRSMLASLFGRPGVLAPRNVREVEVAIRDKVVAPQALVHGSLSFTSRAVLEGELRLERAVDEGARFVPEGKALPVRYAGITAESIGFVFDAPDTRGAYRARFFLEGASAGEDHFFVQR